MDTIINTAESSWKPVAQKIAPIIAQEKQKLGRPLILGILGGQGTGKSTVCELLVKILKREHRLNAITFSLDDLYLPLTEREYIRDYIDSRLDRRGPPGTHDIFLGLELFNQVSSGKYNIYIPRFDKKLHNGQGERIKPYKVSEKIDIVLFEGWFVGVRPIDFDQLKKQLVSIPDNEKDIEFAKDCNRRLKNYLPLWEQLDQLMILAPEHYSLSLQWRIEAEERLRQPRRGISKKEIEIFVKYFWRALHPELYINPLTQDPRYLVIDINSQYNPINIRHLNSWASPSSITGLMTKPINLFEYEALAKQKLSSMAWAYYSSGSLDEATLKDNRSAYERYRLFPRVLTNVRKRNRSTLILGQSLSIPVLIAPMAFQCLAHPDGEIATAKAAQKAGIGMILSTLSTKSIEDVASVDPLRWFQLYIHKDRELTEALVKRAEKAGYSALCLTVDTPLLGRREADVRNKFILPKDLELANLRGLKNLEIPQTESGLFAYFQQQIDPALSWKDIAWLKEITNLPIILKGILRPDDAVTAVQYGINGIIVSNHGGRQLDGAIATLDALPDIVKAVGDKVDILMDGGIRRGTDIFKALALGAKAVLVGRPILWGLSVDGEAGVSHVLELLTNELDLAMALSGCPTINDIESSYLRASTF